MRTPAFVERNMTRITTVVTVLAAITFAMTVIDGMSHITRLAALVFAVSATLEVVRASSTDRKAETAMVSVAAFLLVMEGAGSAIANGFDKASFVEVCIGVYLMTTLWVMVRR